MNRIVLLTVMGITLLAGCKKKTKETQPDSAPPPVTASPNPSPASGNSGSVSALGSGGGIMAPLRAVRREKAQIDLHQLALIIEQLRDPFGKMPTKAEILADLKRNAPSLLKGIEEGAYILTGTMDPGGLWAYEVDADKQSGIAVISGTAQRTNPEDVRRYLGMK